MTSRRSAHHVVLDGRPLVLVDKPRIDFAPGEDGARNSGLNVPHIERGWHRGFGFRDAGEQFTYSSGQNVCSRFGVLMPAGAVTSIPLPAQADGEIHDFQQLGDDLYLVAGQAVVKLTEAAPTTAALDVAVGAGYGGQSIVNFKGDLYVGGDLAGTVSTLWKRTTATGVWSGHATVPRMHLAVINWSVPTDGGVARDYLIGTDQPHTFKFVSADPTVAGNWSAQYEVCPGYHIKALAVSAHAVAFSTDGGIRLVDSRGYSSNITPHWMDNYDQQNGNAAVIYEGKIYAGSAHGLEEIDIAEEARIDRPRIIDPTSLLPQEEAVMGRTNALTTESGYLVGAFYSEYSGSYLWYARQDSEGIWRFSGPEWQVAGQRVTALHVWNPGGVPRLMIGTVAGSTPLLYSMSLPNAANPYQDWQQGGTHRFATSWEATLSRPDWGDPVALKAVQEVEVVAENLSADDPERKIELYDTVDESAEIKLLTANDDVHTVSSPSSAIGYRHKLRVVGTGTAAEPAILHAIKVTADLSRRLPRFLTWVVGIERSGALRTAGRDRRDPRATIRAIENLQWSPPVDATSEDGRALVVDVQRVSEVKTKEATASGWKTAMRIVARVVRDPQLWNEPTWGDGSRW